MSPDRVGPFALRVQIDADHGEELWLAERVAGERRPRLAVVRKAADPRDRAAAARISAEYDAQRSVDDVRLPAALGHFAGQAALATTWAPGPTLADAVTAHRQGLMTMDAATVLDLVGELAEVLRHVHGRRDPAGRPLAHGQLEAHRVRLRPDGGLVLLGLGRPLRPQGPACLAPEILSGAPPSALTDQWALGALLLEMLTGTPLYGLPDGAVAEEATRREGRTTPWIEPVALVNPAMGRLLGRLLAVDPATRFADEGELVRALQAARRSLPGVADRVGLVERLGELGRGPAAEPPPPGAPSQQAPAAVPTAAAPPAVAPAAAATPEEEELTEPIDRPGLLPQDDLTDPLDDGPPLRKRVRSPAGVGRLGLGEKAAIAALIALVLAAVAAVVMQ